ncbi:hypothetical protein SUSAZ_00430 [Sulfolobus acidocaldarius SUSAZ]|nr:hypothetical protein SUSAZ_00430 [Sulfolobus acidocaldarius SUSAZ]
MINLPLSLFGIPIKGVNNPILTAFIGFDAQVKEGVDSPLLTDFKSLFKEATGFECKVLLDITGSPTPLSSSYIYLSELFFRKAIEKCELPLSEEEMWDTLKMIDDVLYNSPLIRALRTSMRMGSGILYRDGEDPIPVSLPEMSASLLFKYPIPNSPLFIDNSLIHLLGILPVEFAETKDLGLFNVENGLWNSLYKISIPSKDRWKLIWDLKYVTGIEVSFYFDNQQKS